MSVRRIVPWLGGAVVVAALAGTVWLGRDHWRTWWDSVARTPAATAPAAAAEDHHDHGHADRVKLTPQAQRDLGLVVRPLQVSAVYWRKMQVPAVIVERPGQSDQGAPAPITGVVSRIFAFPGDTVQPGNPLFELRITSELVLNAQAELFKWSRELQIGQKNLSRLEDAARGGAIPEARLIELRNQQSKLEAQVRAYRQILQANGLQPARIDAVAEGTFVRESTVLAPPLPPGDNPTGTESPLCELQELKVQLGEQVQAGQVLATLANHRLLHIEGRGFKGEAPLLARAAENRWPVEAEFAEDDARTWPPLDQTLTIRNLANSMDPASRTFAFFLLLVNQSRRYEHGGKTFLVWRFRPGQRVRLRVPVEALRGDPVEGRTGEYTGVIVLPRAAVVREGPEAYVFRANGDAFDRKPVHVLFEDRHDVVLANDGSVAPGLFVAHNAAAALQRILKAQSAGESGHEGHGHAH